MADKSKGRGQTKRGTLVGSGQTKRGTLVGSGQTKRGTLVGSGQTKRGTWWVAVRLREALWTSRSAVERRTDSPTLEKISCYENYYRKNRTVGRTTTGQDTE